MSGRSAAVEELERRIGHTFADRKLLERALTHASVGDRRPHIEHNERLEFFGDRVLNLIIAEELLARMPEAREGELSAAFHKLVNLETCAEVARQVGLPATLLMGGGTGKTGIRFSDRVLGDACEALIAALYFDGGLEAARAFVVQAWDAPFRRLGEPKQRHPKVVLQEWAFGRGLPAPRYTVLEQSGPSHKPTFRLELFVQGFEPVTGAGGSIRDAEKVVAEQMLSRIEDVK
ncbi:ribonuclease III [Phenylobacterium kunshanense]|uniref:Ribonuclease 3 n=1 Tax=Phenylobacterium kunshanense TaxID=1445034 RepID=A0A328BRD3_9CAUL|nr:ribonuclease III [Phenylobacterium kunshanense]RAK69111.1 ribonuclease III [Phenylobacterium kunshanense]